MKVILTKDKLREVNSSTVDHRSNERQGQIIILSLNKGYFLEADRPWKEAIKARKRLTFQKAETR